jgi:hypothetical protein
MPKDVPVGDEVKWLKANMEAIVHGWLPKE